MSRGRQTFLMMPNEQNRDSGTFPTNNLAFSYPYLSNKISYPYLLSESHPVLRVDHIGISGWGKGHLFVPAAQAQNNQSENYIICNTVCPIA